MSDDYPLQVLLEMRTKARDDSEAKLAGCVSELQRIEANREQARKRVAVLQTRQAQARRERQRALQAGIMLSDLHVADEYASALNVEAIQAQAEVERISDEWRGQKQKVDRAQHALREIQKDLHAVEKHHESWSEEQATVERRKTSDAMDAIALRMWEKDSE